MQLLPQLLMEQFDALPIQCRHIEHMHERGLVQKKNFGQNDSCENLENFSLIRLLYNVDTLNICMKEFGLEKIFLCTQILLKSSFQN